MRVCFFSGSRSEYGINNYLLRNLFLDKFINLYFVVSGLSKSKGYGMTLQDIKKDNFKVSKNVKINIKKTSANQVSKNFSIILKELSRFLSKNKINLLILIGDRYETLAAALAAYINRVPIVHIHGGEKTVDSLDDNFRHSISKFSKLHFVSHKVYKKRLIQLGENKNDIHIVGGLGAQIIKKFKFLKKKDLERILKLKFESEILVVNFYPESQSNISLKNLKSILSALNLFKNVSIIFTFPTHEIGKDIFVNEIKRFSKIRKNCHYFYNLGQKKYLSLLNISNLLIGNSSSGILEMPSLGKYTINIGERQKGRILSKSVITCEANSKIIYQNIKKYKNLSNHKFKNVYYKERTVENIVKIIKKYSFSNLKKNKNFFDLTK